MATPLVNSHTHDGLERVIAAFGALGTLVRGAMQHSRAAAEKPPSSTALTKTAISPERLICCRDM